MPTVTIGGSAPSSEQAAAVRAAFGIPEADVIAEALATLVGTDQLIVMRAGAPYTATMTAVATYIADVLELTPPAATAPAAFSIGQWTLTAIAGGLRFGITTLPSDGGSALTNLEYSTNNGGAWSSFGAATTGNYDVTGLSEIEYSCMVRAVNAVGNGANSDMKAATPAAAGGGGGTADFVQLARVDTPWSSSVPLSFPVAATAGNAVFVVVTTANGVAAPTAVVGSDSVSFGSPIYTYVGADQTNRYYGLANVSAITGVTVTLPVENGSVVNLFEVAGLGTTFALDDSDGASYGSGTSPWEFAVTPTVTGTFMIATMNLLLDAWPVGSTPVVAGPASSLYSLYAYAEIAASGLQTLEVDMTTDGTTPATRAGERSWIVVRAGS